MSADLTALANALPGLELAYADVRKVFSELEAFAEQCMHGPVGDDVRWEHVWNEQVFEHRLKRLHLFVQMALEAADLPMALQKLQAEWKAFKDVTKTYWIHEVDALGSDPLDCLGNAIDGIRVLVSSGESPIQMADAKRLRDLLEATAHLLHRRGIVPAKEHHIQEVMNDYLHACFLGDYTKNPQVSGFIKNFNADGGVKSLSTAIEFKFVTSLTEMKQAASGIIEDTAGYNGSKDWTTFYSVVYQTQPFATAAHFRAEMKRVGGLKWTPIVVGGEGAKSPKKAKAPTSAKAKSATSA